MLIHPVRNYKKNLIKVEYHTDKFDSSKFLYCGMKRFDSHYFVR